MSEHHPHRWHHRARSALRRSLRLRLILVFWLLALVMAAIFLGGMQRALGSGWRQAALPLLGDYVDRLTAEIGTPPSVERAQAITQRLPVAVRIDGPAVRWSSAKFVSVPDWQDANSGRPDHGPHLLERHTADGHRIEFGLGALPWKSQPRVIGWATLLLLLSMTAMAYAYLRRLLRPLDDIRMGARRFGRGDFGEAITVRRHDELGHLAQQINAMAQGLHQMLEDKRALLLAISHELRSPLTRARLNAELLPERGDIDSTRAALLRDLAEMRDLIADLLEGERLSGAHVALQREPVDLDALVQDLLASRGEFQGIQFVRGLRLAPLQLDAMRIRLALRNLLDNAVRHGVQATQAPTVSITGDGGGVRVMVRDHGPGVDEAQLPQLAQAFYRTDSARQRATGGVGLGLYLCRLVAQAHGGQLLTRNAHPGLEVTLVLPASAA
ncbi:MAG: HAMP domain-containing sensor histidine kinase [Burkholderiaceae bacterium]